MPDESPRSESRGGDLLPPPWPQTLGWLLGGAGVAALVMQTVLQNPDTAGVFLARPTWAERFGDRIDPATQLADVSLLGCLLITGLMAAAVAWSNRRDPLPPSRWFGLASVGLLVWLVFEFAVNIAGGQSGDPESFAAGTVFFSTSISGTVVATWLAVWGLAVLRPWRPAWSMRTAAIIATAACVAFVAASLWMNTGLMRSMRVPHGDSAMYEEHLWNTLHGKGFRSYLDQGLFLGEHIQVIHLLLLPVYWLWPSQTLLELAEALALAACCPLVMRIARRHGASPQAAAMLGTATLLYAPLQYLDISIDQKSFRPITFGVPLLLWTIDAIERRRWKETAAAVLLTLACKEDFTLVLIPLGGWMAAVPTLGLPRDAAEDAADAAADAAAKDAADRRTVRTAGLILAGGSLAYLLLSVLVIIPAFRGGEQTHYAADYYPQLGRSTGEIVVTCLTQPWVPLGVILAAPGLAYLVHTLVPLGGSPLLTPSRLAVALPALGITILNKFTEQAPQPVHHFHAPVVPVLLWAMAAAGPSPHDTAGRWASRLPDRDSLARWVLAIAFTTGLFDGFGPLSVRFYDPGHAQYAGRLYFETDRSRAWDAIDALIPPDARVASTDHIRPRLTHRDRNYDYGQVFRRAVSDYEDRVPHDADWIVLDRQGPYSTIDSLDEIRELRREPEQWDVVADGAFIVLKRR